MYMYMYVCVYIYIYIYVFIEPLGAGHEGVDQPHPNEAGRERGEQRDVQEGRPPQANVML